MAILWAATSIADAAFISGATVNLVSGNISVDVSEGIATDAAQFVLSPVFPAQSDFWFSETSYFNRSGGGTPTGDNQLIAFTLADGTSVFRVRIENTAPPWRLLAEKRTGPTTWALLGSGVLTFINTRSRIDAKVKLGSSGEFKLYVNGTLNIDFSGDTLPDTGPLVSRVRLGGPGGTSTWSAHSGVIVADEDTRPMTFVQRLPNGNGAHADWNGSYTAIDETGINDADYIDTADTGDISTFTFAALPVGMESRNVVALVLSGRARSSGGIAEIEGVARVGSTDYTRPSKFEASPQFTNQQWQFSANPATGQLWLGSEINAAQFGVKAA